MGARRTWRRWCWECEVGSLEEACFVCGRPMGPFTEYTRRRVDQELAGGTAS